MRRKQANRVILLELYNLIEKYPDLRFGQILVDCDIIKFNPTDSGFEIVDPFYEESEVTLERVMNSRIVREEYN